MKFKKIFQFNYIIYFICTVFIFFAVYLYTIHLLHNDLLFHTDIARDFLLIEDTVTSHKLTLLGPRAGGIPGVFFGPIWIYLNIPIYILSNGNPIGVGYFWIVLMIMALLSTFFVAKRVFGISVAFLSTFLFAYTIIFLAPGFNSDFAQVIFSPLFLYSLYLFITEKRARYLGIAAFLCGLLFQFQPAFGMIFFLIAFIISIIETSKIRKLKFLLTWFFALIPLFNYVLFEPRHKFLQTRAFFNFIFHHQISSEHLTVGSLAQNRLDGFFGTQNISGFDSFVFNSLFFVLNLYILYIVFRNKKVNERTFILLFYCFFIGFWLLTLFYKGVVWDYYHWGFLPLFSIVYASLFKYSKKILFLPLFAILLYLMVVNGISSANGWVTAYSDIDSSSWLLNKQAADFVYQDAKGEFGYYVYSTDEFGYSLKYAMDYAGRIVPNKGDLCKKKSVTYLLYDPTPPGSKTDPVYWKRVRVKILGNPAETKKFSGIVVEKYDLTNEQLAVPSDPNLICDLSFR